MLNELYNDLEYKTLLEHISSQYKRKGGFRQKANRSGSWYWYIYS